MNTAIIKPQWSPLTIALMVLCFVSFWPLGLAMLGYILLVVGIIGLLLSLIFWSSWAGPGYLTGSRRRVVDEDVVDRPRRRIIEEDV